MLCKLLRQLMNMTTHVFLYSLIDITTQIICIYKIRVMLTGVPGTLVKDGKKENYYHKMKYF